MPPGVSRMILTAQEDLRREIARQMHDGPAQSLTNIVLQAQIVDRLMTQAPEKAAGEVDQLIAMVQRTLDATKTFIFDVRPMVLDDLGPRADAPPRQPRPRQPVGVTVDFESVGVDRRLPPELESGLFRMLDDALAAHVAKQPDRLSLHLDWGERSWSSSTPARTRQPVPDPGLPPDGAELPPALADMVERAPARLQRRARGRARRERCRGCPTTPGARSPPARRSSGSSAEMLDDGARLRLEVELPAREAVRRSRRERVRTYRSQHGPGPVGHRYSLGREHIRFAPDSPVLAARSYTEARVHQWRSSRSSSLPFGATRTARVSPSTR